MNSEYKGMRWVKCDFQVQTPEDSRHWLDDGLKLLEPRRPKNEGVPDESDIQEKARTFLRRCYELKLQAIGLTDHNFSARTEPRDWFAVHLVEQNRTVAREFDVEPLAIFPGFEIDIGYHVLCLFQPARKKRDFERCNRILTKLGLSEDVRFDATGPKQLRRNGQRVSLKTLLEIVQDEHDGIVIAAHADQARGIFSDAANRDDYSNQELYCVELTQNPPANAHGDILAGKNPAWIRAHWHPAWVMSSDAKSIRVGDDGQAPPNSLGYRHTWIKMSKPSIEALRQAFLDSDSRISRPDDIATDISPAERDRHTVISSLSICGAAFIADQDIVFSPNMSCMIGGRGSGKSSILEYLRIALGKDVGDNMGPNTVARIKRIHGTLGTDAEIRVTWMSAEGVIDEIIWAEGQRWVSDRDLPNPDTFFENLPVEFYSQQQLNALTETRGADGENHSIRQAERLLSLVDGFAKRELMELDERARRLKREAEESFSKSRRADELEIDRSRKQQEYAELDRQWKARSNIQDAASRYQQLKGEARYLASIDEPLGKRFSDVAALAEAAAEAHAPFELAESPHADWMRQYDAQVRAAKEQTARAVREAVDGFYAQVDALRSNSPDWQSIQSAHEQADEAFRLACEEKGLEPGDVGRLQEISADRASKQREIDALNEQVQQLRDAAGNPEQTLGQLHDIWRDQFEMRQAAAARANELAKMDGTDQAFVEVSAGYQGDRKSFGENWKSFAPADGRSRLGRNWFEIGHIVHRLFCEDPASPSPWQKIRDLLERNGEDQLGEIREHLDALGQHVQQNPEQWTKLRLSRVDDTLDLKLFRQDGTVAGSIADGTLSDGQRNTAALALLLAQSGGPLVIDQPEDELDSNFVFQELIPLLRRVKTKRQVIMSTHNANLPVNGDAELVCALEARQNHGEVIAEGGLDQSEVTKAVLDIMEGTEEAFRRRREKYHF